MRISDWSSDVCSSDLGRLSGIVAYEPEELVLTAAAATPLREIEAALRERRQMMAFEPMDYGPLLGGEAGSETGGGTIGGLPACNLAEIGHASCRERVWQDV